MYFQREDKLALSSTRRAANRGRCSGRWLWVAIGALVFLLWNQKPAGITRRLSLPAKQRIAFVVLTDPHEDHSQNVIPMLAHVEAKYGESLVVLKHS